MKWTQTCNLYLSLESNEPRRVKYINIKSMKHIYCKILSIYFNAIYIRHLGANNGNNYSFYMLINALSDSSCEQYVYHILDNL